MNVNEPRKSLLLIKPTKPNDSVADPTLYFGTHNGGERWAGNEASPQYQTILEWIRGAKTSPATSFGLFRLPGGRPRLFTVSRSAEFVRLQLPRRPILPG